MAPIRPRTSIPPDRFKSWFPSLKAIPYTDPNSSRGPNAQNNIRSIAWNPLGTLVATGAADKTLRVWNPEKPNVRFSTELKGHTAPIEKVAFNPAREAELCSAGSDGVVKFWDVRSKACVNEVKGLGDAHTLVWAPDGESLVVGNKGGTNKPDTAFIISPKKNMPVSTHELPIASNQIVFCWSGEKIFATTVEGRTRVLKFPEFDPLFHYAWMDEPAEFNLKGHTSSCLSTELSPTGRHLATGGADSIITLWDTSDWICQKTITKMSGPVTSMSFTFDGAYIVGGSTEASSLEINNVETGEHLCTMKLAGSTCPTVSFSPNRYCLAYTDLGSLRIIGVDAERK